MFTKYRAVLRLLICPVPAGFFPVATFAATWEVIRSASSSGSRRIQPPPPGAGAYVGIGICALLSVVALYFFSRMIRRAGTATPDENPYEMSGAAWKTALWGGFAAGVACGIAMFVSIR